MSLRMYQCHICEVKNLAFQSEQHTLHCLCDKGKWDEVPLAPRLVHASNRYMVEYLLDSVYTIHEKASDMIQQNADERELKQYQKAIINQ